MCGIFGIVNTKGATLTDDERAAWARLAAGLATLSTARGTDSTGVARVASDGAAAILKDAVPAWELIASGEWLATVTPQDGTFAVVGHTRWATHGAVTQANAHPFLFDDGTRATLGVHNGVVNNHAALRGADDKVYAVDSANLIAALAAEKMSGWQAVLRRAEGTLALALVRSAPGAETALTLTRRGNPLWVAVVGDCGGALAFASTKAILEGALRGARMRGSEARELEEGVFYRWGARGSAASSRWARPAKAEKKAARRARHDAAKVHHHATIEARGKAYTQCAACLDWYPRDELTECRGALLCPGDHTAATSWQGRRERAHA